MMRTTLGKLVWGTAFWAVLSVATAGDILLIEKVEERQSRDLPGNGLSMSQVESRYGSPVEKRSAVGDPPITRWIYPDYSVFFEHDLVIESVVRHSAVVREAEAQGGS
jgi:hypothetical protein